MLFIVIDERQSLGSDPPLRPMGYDGIGPSAALPLLDR